MRILLLVLAAGILILMMSARARAAVRRRLPQLLLYGGGLALILLAVSGRLPWLFGIVGGIAAAAMRLLPLALRLPQLAWLWRTVRNGGEADSRTDGEPPARHGRMTPREARDLLGVGPDATRDEISAAHRRLIQRMHPDRGGSAGLAARINEARDTLLGRRSAA